MTCRRRLSCGIGAMWLLTVLATSSVRADLAIRPFVDLRVTFEDNVFQVSEAQKPQDGTVTQVWAGLHATSDLSEDARFAARYEAAPRRFGSFDRLNRHDHLLSLSYRHRLRRDLTALVLANAGLRVQPTNAIHEYDKQDLSVQASYRLNARWSAALSTELRRKAFPNNKRANYASIMLASRLVRRLGLSSVGVGYQIRSYAGAIDPRVLQADINRDMEGVRHVARLWYEHLLTGAVLLRATYRIEVDVAVRELQAQERFQREPEQTSRLGDDDDDDDEVDFNFVNHRPSISVVWRFMPRTSLQASTRHYAKYFRDWVVPDTSDKRRDNLTLLRLTLKRSFDSMWAAQVEYALERNRSNDPNQQYSANAYSLRLQATF